VLIENIITKYNINIIDIYNFNKTGFIIGIILIGIVIISIKRSFNIKLA
jgi:hypothetical protein